MYEPNRFKCVTFGHVDYEAILVISNVICTLHTISNHFAKYEHRPSVRKKECVLRALRHILNILNYTFELHI